MTIMNNRLENTPNSYD